jgi:sugar lactone lactonase YvrE
VPTARLLADDIYFGEAPRWHGGRLWFSDFYDRAVRSVDAQGLVRTELTLDDQPSGLGWLPDGRLLVVAMNSLEVRRQDRDGLQVHAQLSGISEHLTNDMVVDAHGGAYVGCFGFDIHAQLNSHGPVALLAHHPTTRLARVDADGRARIAATDMHFPNGMVITPDGRTLIVAETLGACLTAFDIETDGSLSNRRLWASLGARLPDGICLNADGHVWVSNAVAPECVLFAVGGEIVDVVETGLPCFACMLGGDDGQTLFTLTAPTSNESQAAAARNGCIMTTHVNVGRAGWP